MQFAHLAIPPNLYERMPPLLAGDRTLDFLFSAHNLDRHVIAEFAKVWVTV